MNQIDKSNKKGKKLNQTHQKEPYLPSNISCQIESRNLKLKNY